jgi:hypothetical protein
MYPSSPIVVQSEGSEAFVMCTIPKAGCSLLRSLLLVATRFPRPINWVGDRAHVHMVRSSVVAAASMYPKVLLPAPLRPLSARRSIVSAQACKSMYAQGQA